MFIMKQRSPEEEKLVRALLRADRQRSLRFVTSLAIWSFLATLYFGTYAWQSYVKHEISNVALIAFITFVYIFIQSVRMVFFFKNHY